MPVDIAVFHNLLNRFQDAALEPSRWPSLLEQIAEATGAGGINVMAPASSGSVGGILFTEFILDHGSLYKRRLEHARPPGKIHTVDEA